MKKRLLLGLLCITTLSEIMAQSPGDVITVETFNYSETGDPGIRDKVIEFPDNDVSYEKIIMLYNMRCKDGNVSPGVSGQTNIGCGEWDYSCNTYIIDSLRTDSISANHPTHTITGFSGNTFNYIETPVYNHYQYTMQEVLIDATLSETSSMISSGSDNINHLLSVTNESGKSQFLLSATELNDAGVTSGDLTGLKLDFQNGGSDANFLRIKMKSTTNSVLDASTLDTDGFTEVYFQNLSPAVGVEQFQFYTPFTWDGSSNIIVEFDFTNGNTQDALNILGENTVTGKALASNRTDHYASFAGSGQYLNLPDTSIVFDGGLTISGWVYYNEFAHWSRIIDFGNGAGVDNIILANPGTSNDLNLSIRSGGSNIGMTVEDVLETEQWMHIAATVATDGTANIYINGELVGTQAHQLPDNVQRTRNYIGRSNWNNDAYFDGKIDDISMWNVALTQSEITEWMYKDIDNTHPYYNQLLFSYSFNDNTANDNSNYNHDAEMMNSVATPLFRGPELFKNMDEHTGRPNIELLQGSYEQTINDLIVTEDVEILPNIVKTYEILSQEGTQNDDLVQETSENMYWEAGLEYTYDAATGLELDAEAVTATGAIEIGSLNYQRRYPSKYEIMSFVTPYGINLDMGTEGKTWTFDMTDFAPILKGKKRMTMERGGQRQEDMDIKFLFYVGTPPRDVVDIEQIWRTESRNYSSINNDSYFAPRDVMMNSSASAFKIRSSITGHGQEGEFIPREHYIDINGGANEFSWDVWKTCASNPVYPQGGTWIYDRAGWCPGMATDLQEFDITSMVTPGETTNIDYGMETASGDSRYIVNHQLVSYGSANFSLDARILDVEAPSSKVEYARNNSMCDQPRITIQNTGSTTLTSAVIEFWANDNTHKTYNWTGNLAFLEKETFDIPISSSVWENVNPTGNEFHVLIKNPNGGADEYELNDRYTSTFDIPEVLPANFYVQFRANSAASENSYELVDYYGNTMFSRSGMENNATYRDTFNLGTGCYKLIFKDNDGDGVDFWANSDGSGSIRLKREENGNNLKTFEGDFGASLVYSFTVDFPLSYEELHNIPTVEILPNPAKDFFSIKAKNIDTAEISIISSLGQRVSIQHIINQQSIRYNTSNLPSGLYFLTIDYDGKRISKKVVIE